MAHEAEIQEARDTISTLTQLRESIVGVIDSNRSLLRDAGYGSLVTRAEDLAQRLAGEISRAESWINANEGHPNDPSPPSGSPGQSRPAPPSGKGDVDGDGKVSERDAELARKIAVGEVQFTTAADVTGDGDVTSRDALEIANYAKGNLDTFPVDEPADPAPPEPKPPEDPPTQGQPAPASGLGDVDGDGRVTKRDAELIVDMAVGKVARDPAADVDGDGDISSRDALMVTRYAEGKMNSFPADDVDNPEDPPPEQPEPPEDPPPEQPEPPEDPPTQGQPAPASGLGDVDGDGRVTKRDVELIQEMALGNEPEDPKADVIGDGNISSRDALMVAQYAKGEISSFPAENSQGSDGLSGAIVTVRGSR